jgi:hypothetical protein
MLTNTSFPQAPLEGANFKPSKAGPAPQINSVERETAQTNLIAEESLSEQPSADWLGMARNAYDASDSWLQINQRAIWARNFAHYRSEHAPDSVLHNESHRHRAKHFWPKTRTMVRSLQAAAASAFFSSSDVAEITALDQDNGEQVDAAGFMKNLVDFRLKQTIPWYKIVLGAIADTAVTGTIVSHQSWHYEEEETVIGRELDEDTGEVVEYVEVKVLHDAPKVRPVPAENIRISPAADWLDPANSSPYLIEMIPMFAGDVITRMQRATDTKAGEPAWRNIGIQTIIGAGSSISTDSTRKARTGQGRQDPKADQNETVDEFRLVWIHRNIIRHNGIDWLYYTAGTTILLSDPVRLDSVIPWANGKRDYVMGNMEVETDSPYPSGSVELTSGLQRAFNELGNQRFDNVRQVLNRRYLYRAGNQVDTRALTRNAPGGLIAISAPGELKTHVSPLDTPDVTQSSYKEADMLGLAMDDLSGTTSGSSVNANRKLQETATGMNLLADSANAIREMELKTFSSTWYAPVLQQLVQLIAMYETDATAMTVSARKAKLLRVLPEFFNHKFTVEVNVGMGATNPTQRMQRLQGAVATAVQLVPEAAAAINGEAVVKEVFAVAGYDNGTRFFDFQMAKEKQANPPEDPSLALQREQLQLRHQIDMGKLEATQAKLELETAKTQLMLQELQSKIKNIDADTASKNVNSVLSATQVAANISQTPEQAPIVDTVLKSTGFKDENGGTTP